MGKKLLAVVAIAAVAVGAYWILQRGSGGPPDLSGLPPINVDDANLTEAGQKEYKRILKLAGRIKRASPVRRYDLADDFVWKLHKLGDYEGAIQWHLKLAEWLEEMSPGQRKATRRGKRGEDEYAFTVAMNYQVASFCCFVLGQDVRGIRLLETYFRKYPQDSTGRIALAYSYREARESPESFRESALEYYAVDPKYVKSPPRR